MQTLDWSDPELIHKSTRRHRPQMMLTLLGYCYAAGIYSSQRIEEATRENETVRYICARDYPDLKAIRQFRRANRALVERCLAIILRGAWSRGHDITDPQLSRLGRCHSRHSDCFQKEAFQRVDMAVFMDLMERED